jgi:uncharacterized protein YegL
MKDNLTEIVFIIDRSGSMQGLELDTIGGYNQFLEKQKQNQGEATISTILFDDRFEVLHDRLDLKHIKPITLNEYFVRGSTALFDVIGNSIDRIGNQLSNTEEHNRPSKVIFVITTDGMENASKTYSYEKVKDMIEHQKTKYNWEFIFIGANFDAESFAESIGIAKDRSVKYQHSNEGILSSFFATDYFISDFRSDSSFRPDDSWKKKVKQDL